MLDDLEPRLLWENFARICAIPHCSEHEGALRDDLLAQARARGWSGDVDDVGNLVIRIPAKPGWEGAPTLVLQNHLDMVCEKNNDTAHDFATQGIDAYVDGEVVRARGTTLGSDNGIGVATALALGADPEVQHGPLEVLCTVEEETGLVGAGGIDASLLTGRILLNLDTEEEGAIYIGCAGGGDQLATLRPARRAPVKDTVAMEVKVGGLLGGHSGLQIELGRGNAIVILARLLDRGLGDGLIVGVDTIAGGNMHNAIPREARAVVRVSASGVGSLEDLVQLRLGIEKEALGEVDPGLVMSAQRTGGEQTTILAAAFAPFVRLLLELPHGVVAMSEEIEGLVETSTNLAVVRDTGEALTILTSSRSSVASSLTELRDRICAMLAAAGGEVHREQGYPGWQPDLSSALLARARGIYQREFGRAPEVKAIHAGLECGIIGERIPEMDMISIGPSIHSPHSPGEYIEIPSVQKFWVFVKALVEDLAQR